MGCDAVRCGGDKGQARCNSDGVQTHQLHRTAGLEAIHSFIHGSNRCDSTRFNAAATRFNAARFNAAACPFVALDSYSITAGAHLSNDVYLSGPARSLSASRSMANPDWTAKLNCGRLNPPHRAHQIRSVGLQLKKQVHFSSASLKCVIARKADPVSESLAVYFRHRLAPIRSYPGPRFYFPSSLVYVLDGFSEMNPGSPVMISIIETAASHLSLNAHSPAAAADGASMAVGNDATRADSLAPQDGHPPSLLKIRSAEGTSLDGQDSVSKNGNQELQPCKSDILAHEHARLHNLDRRSNLSFSDNPAGAGPTPLPSKQRVEPDTDRLILLGDLKTPPACTPSIRSLQDRGMPRTSSESESSRAGETDVSVLKRGSFNPSGSIVFRHVPGSGTDSSLVPQRLLHSPRSSIEIHTSRDSCRSEGNPQSPKISGLKRRNISLRAKPSVKSNRSSHKKENTEQSLPPQSVEINGCCDFPPELIQQVQCGMAGYFDFAEFCERLNSTCDYLDGIVKKAARRQKRLQRKGLSEACPPGENQPGLADAVDGDQQLKSSFNISEMAVSMSRSISSRRSTASKDIDISKPPAGLPWKHPAWSPLRFVKRYIKRFVRFVRRKIRNDCEEGEQQRVALLSASALLAISNIPCPPVPANCQQMDSLELALYYYHQKEPNFCVHYLEKSSQEGNPMGLFFLGMSNLPSWYDGCAAAGAAPGDAAPSWVPACGNRFRALQLFLKSVDTTLINLPSVMRWRTKGEVIFEDTSKFDGDHSRKPNRPNLIHSSSVHQELVASKSGSITSLFASGVLWTNPGLRSTLVRARCESVANNSLSRHLFGSTNMETSMSALSSFASMFSFTDQSGGRRLLKGLDDLEVAATLLPNPLYEISMILRCGGDGVPVSRAASAYFMSVAAALGDTDAQYEYGYCLIHGLGVSKNLMEAARWLRQAHAGGRRVEGEGWIFKKKWGGEE